MTSDARSSADWFCTAGNVLIALGIASSSLTFNWIVDHNAALNFFPEFAGRVIYLSDVFLTIGIAMWFAGWNLQSGWRLRTGPRYIAIPLALLLALTAASIVWAAYPAQTGYATLRRAVLLSMYVVLVSDAANASRWVVRALVAVAVLHAVLSYVQVIHGTGAGLQMLGEIGPSDDYYRYLGCPRPAGLGFNPNPVGMVLGIGVAVTGGLFLYGEVSTLVRAAWLVAFEVALIGLMMTMSRNATVGCLLGLAAVMALGWIRNRETHRELVKRGALIVLLIMLTTRFYPVVAPLSPRCGTWPARYAPQVVRTAGMQRLDDLYLAGPIVRENFWIGVGAANYPITLAKRLGLTKTTPVHNVPLLMLAELGVAGIACWLAIMCAPIVWVWAQRRGAPLAATELIWLGPVILLLFNGLLDFPTWATQDGRVFMMAALGLWAGASESDQKNSKLSLDTSAGAD